MEVVPSNCKALDPPETVKLMVSLLQIGVEGAETIVGVGIGLTRTKTVVEQVPMSFVETVYNVVTAGLAITDVPVV